VLPNNPPAQLFSSSSASTLDRLSTSLSKLNYNITDGGFAGVSVNFDPSNSGASADLSSRTSIVFGVDSDKVKKVKMEIEDKAGNIAVFYITGISVSRKYYEFLRSVGQIAGINMAQVKKINFTVDQSSIDAGQQIGFVNLQLGGLQP